MQQTQATYLLIPEKESKSIERDLEQLVVAASSYDARIKAVGATTLEYMEAEEILTTKLAAKKDHILLTTNRINMLAILCVREAAKNQGYRTYSVELGCFLPEDNYLRDLVTFRVDNAIEEILLKAGFDPVFIFLTGKENVIYARKKDQKEIFIVNPHIIEYYKAYGYDNDNAPELSYIVAPDITKFAPLFDVGLIPIFFYEGYGKKDKIYNYSYFDIDKPDKKIFVKPLVFELEDRSGKFYIKAGDKGSMLIMDKIRPGEQLHDTIMRFLKEQNLADDYVGAIVSRDIEFDRDREGRLTPRIIVLVYVDKFKSYPPQLKRSWIPRPSE